MQVRRLLAAQSAVSASTPNIISSISRPSAAPAPVVSRPAGVASSGYALGKPAGSILSSASRPGMISDVRSSQAAPSPLRARAGMSAAGLGARARGVGESPMKGASADKLASDFSRLQAPSAAVGRPSYILAQR